MNLFHSIARRTLVLLVLLFSLSGLIAQESDSLIDAFNLFQDKKYEDALTLCKDIIEQSPTNADANMLLGRVYFAMGDLDNAKTYVDIALNMDLANPEYREIRNSMSAFQSKLTEASRFTNSGDLNGAIKVYQEMIVENPNFADGYYSLARTQVRVGALAEARENFHIAIEMKPQEERYKTSYDAATAQFLKDGNQLMQRRNNTAAMEKFRQAAELNPDDYLVQYFLAVVYREENDFDKALEAVNRSIEINSEYSKSQLVKGKIYLKLKNYEEAQAAFEKAIQLDETYIDAWNNLGNLFYSIKKYDEAIPAFKKVIDLKPDYGAAYANLGAIEIELKNYADAIKYLKKAVEMKDNSYTSWLRLAQAYNHQGKCPEAKEAAEETLKIKANYAPALIELGVAERCLGNRAAAKQALQMAAKDPKWKRVAEFELKTLE